MAFNYTYLDLKTALNESVHGKVENLVDVRALINRAVRETFSEIDLRSAKRRSTISPGLYGQVYNYAKPADLKGSAICDIIQQVKRKEEFYLVNNEEFDVRKEFDKGMVAIDDRDKIGLLRISIDNNTQEVILDDMEVTTGWTAAAGASNLAVDSYNFVNGSASLSFDLDASGATATLTKSTLTAADLTSEENHEIFLYVYIPLTTLLTSFTLKWGSSASDYWSATSTTTHEGLAWQTGWNLVRFTWPASATGTPDVTDITYAQLTINRAAGFAASNGWRVDYLVARVGEMHDVLYYTKYGWNTSAGAYLENSTADTDVVVADTEEFDLIVQKASTLAAPSLRLEVNEKKEISDKWKEVKENYKMSYPSEKMLFTSSYHRLASLEGDLDVNKDSSNFLDNN